MRMGRADQDGLGSDTAALMDRLAGFLDQAPGNHQRINTHQRHAGLAVVKDSRPDFAGVVEAAVIRLTVPARLLHSELGRDVALREACLEGLDVSSLRQSRRRDSGPL